MNKRLKQLYAVPIGGNHNADSQLWNDLMLFALDEREPIKDRANALRYLDEKVLGVTPPNLQDKLMVETFVKEHKDNLGEDFQGEWEKANGTVYKAPKDRGIRLWKSVYVSSDAQAAKFDAVFAQLMKTNPGFEIDSDWDKVEDESIGDAIDRMGP